MSAPYIGEIRQFAGNFAPNGWLFCDGSLQSISDNETLFNLIGTTYGGDGQQTFGLPQLLGRVPIHMGTNQGTNYALGQLGGSESVTINLNQLPAHTHVPSASNAGGQDTPTGNVWGNSSSNLYAATPNVVINNASITSTGGNLSHENRIPFQAINYIISLYGIYPSPQ